MDPDKSQDFIHFRIRSKPWWIWPLRGLWCLAEILFLQAALASAAEYEPRAAILFWLLFTLLALGGITVLIYRRIGS